MNDLMVVAVIVCCAWIVIRAHWRGAKAEAETWLPVPKRSRVTVVPFHGRQRRQQERYLGDRRAM